MDAGTRLYLIGTQAVLQPGDDTGDAQLAFYERAFSRARAVPGITYPTRIVRYERQVPKGTLTMLGIEARDGTPAPDGMVSWTLSGRELNVEQWERGRPDELSREDIRWDWMSERSCGGCAHAVGDVTPHGGTPYLLTGLAPEDTSRTCRDDVVVVPYDPAWPALYEACAAWIRTALGQGFVTRTEHFGSTAIPDMPAKPVLDLLVEVPSVDEARRRALSVLTGPSWEHWRYGDHCMSIRRDGFMGVRTHHLHYAPRGHELWERTAFRDHLRSDAGDARRYAELKGRLAEAYGDDRERYTRAKASFVEEVTRRALAIQKRKYI